MPSGSPFEVSNFSFVAGDLSPHRNPVTCVLAGRDRALIVKGVRERLEGDIVMIRPGVEHAVEIRGAARVLYLNGIDYPFPGALADILKGRLAHLAASALDGDADAQRELRARLQAREAHCSPSLADVLQEMRADPMRRMTQGELASRLGLERTRALRYFKTVTGMTYRRFKQWSGLQAAARQIAKGERIRTAALDAGFSDTAHLTRTFRTFFGVTPTEATADLARHK